MPIKKENRLTNRWWRLNNLYHIKDKNGIDCIMKWNSAQRELYENMHTRNVILKARQRGFTTAICILALDLCLFNDGQNAGIIAHVKEDATNLFEEKIRYPYEKMPEDFRTLRKARHDRSGELRFDNGSSIRVGTSFRSGTLQLLHISECGKLAAMFPHRAEEVRTGAFPAAEKGIIFIESTAEGASGLFWDICKAARDFMVSGNNLHKKAWKFHFFPWYDQEEYRLHIPDFVIPSRLSEYFRKLNIKLDLDQKAWYVAEEANQGNRMKREYPATPDEAFEEAVEGSYYANEIFAIRNQKRFCNVSHEPGVPVHTCWDLGMSDSTAIWFYQNCGREIHWIDYYENSGYGLNHYADFLRKKMADRNFSYGNHYMPHDIQVREYSGDGKSRFESAKSSGIWPIIVAPKKKVEDGIEAVRRILPISWFDEEHTDIGFKHLTLYQREWDSGRGVWKTQPMRNSSTHGADSFRYGAVTHRFGIQEQKTINNKSMQVDIGWRIK